MDDTIGCTLPYRFRSPISFDVEAASRPGQIVTSETLTLTPDVPVERWTMPASGNRHLRVGAMFGPFTLDGWAEAALAPVLEASQAVTGLAARARPSLQRG